MVIRAGQGQVTSVIAVPYVKSDTVARSVLI